MQSCLARLLAVCAALSLLLSGCLSQVIPEPAPPPVTYDFGPLPEETEPRLPMRFRLERVTAPSWLESTNIYYRRLDTQPAALRPYAQNIWIAGTPELFEERLAYRLAQATPEIGAESLPLDLEIVSFEHVYASAGNAYVVARARATYEDANGRLRTQAFEQRLPAEAEVGGATSVMPVVADNLLSEVIDWLRQDATDLDP